MPRTLDRFPVPAHPRPIWAWPLLLSSLLVACSDDLSDPLPFAMRGDYFAVHDGSRYRPLFLKGMNLGVGVPGTRPGELAISHEQYLRWFQRMADLGVNSVRVYTLHHPRLYEALFEYNNYHPERPLYLLQGIWLDEDNPSGTFDLDGLTESFTRNIEEAIDCIHGNRDIPERMGRAYGAYVVDVSRWVLGFIIGREIFPDEVVATNNRHPGLTSFSGPALRLASGQPAEAWAASHLDHVMSYEREHYGTQRPVGWSSWPTLDPLVHRTENHFTGGEDSASIDLANLQLHQAPGGFFVSFHAYPYYPNFISEEPSYRAYSDADGPNSYVGYLTALRQHYGKVPLLVGEYGVPSSWGNAHYAQSGMHHGGHDEVAQGHFDARLARNIYDTHCAGGMLFHWIDEWWKRTWIVDELAFPRDRYRLWHNLTSPEQNFGLLAFDPPPPDFEAHPAVTATGRIRQVQAATTVEFFHVRIELGQALAQGETLTIGFDTYRDDVGESVLPNMVGTTRRCELVLVITAPDQAQLHVTRSYDLFGIWHLASTAEQLYHSTATDSADWVPVRWMNDGAHRSDDNSFQFPATTQEIGRLRVRGDGQQPSSLDAVTLAGKRVDVRIPWTLLQFSDPTRLMVMDDDRKTPVVVQHGASSSGRETAHSEGIRLVISSDGAVVETGRYTWEPWDEAPATVEREKPSMAIFGAGLSALPSWLDRD